MQQDGCSQRSLALVVLIYTAALTCLARPDVAPPEYLRELEKLQDQIPPFCNDQVRAAWPLGLLAAARGCCLQVAQACSLHAAVQENACTAHARLHVSSSVGQPACAAAGLRFAAQAFAVIQSEYGVPASQVFSSISPEAVAGAGSRHAAASLATVRHEWHVQTSGGYCCRIKASVVLLWPDHALVCTPIPPSLQPPAWGRCTEECCALLGRRLR